MILRAPAADDVPRMYALLDAASRASFGEGESEEEFRLWLDSPHIDVVRDIRVADDAGELVGYADVDPVGDAIINRLGLKVRQGGGLGPGQRLEGADGVGAVA